MERLPLSLDELVGHWTLLDDERDLIAGPASGVSLPYVNLPGWTGRAAPVFLARTCGNVTGGTLRSTDDTPCDLDIYYVKASKEKHQRCEDNPE